MTLQKNPGALHETPELKDLPVGSWSASTATESSFIVPSLNENTKNSTTLPRCADHQDCKCLGALSQHESNWNTSPDASCCCCFFIYNSTYIGSFNFITWEMFFSFIAGCDLLPFWKVFSVRIVLNKSVWNVPDFFFYPSECNQA